MDSLFLRRTWLPTALIAAAVLLPLCASAAWYVTGGRAAIVATPSMGSAAPVGTVVLTRPAQDIRVGDVITYRPPSPLVQHTTTHRVVAVDARAPGGPVYTARGDINGADDPWAIRPGDVVGRAVALGWGLGWLVRAAPALLVGGLLIGWVTRRWTTPFWRVPFRVLGTSLLIAAVTAWLRPFVGVVTLATTADAAGSHISLVSTGLLPLRVAAATGGHVDLTDGQTGVLTTTLPDGARGAVLTSGVHMPWWLWVVMTLVWLTPMACGLVAALRNPQPGDRGPGRPRSGRGLRTAGVGAAVVAFTAVLAPATSTTTSAFGATVTNSANTAGSTAYFTCRGAATGVAAAFLVWPLADAVVLPLSTAADVSGNGRTGTYLNLFTGTTNAPCPRDTPVRAVTLTPTALTPSYVTTAGLTPARSSNVFTVAIWFRTTTTTGGRLIGWGNAQLGPSTAADRHLYMTSAGNVVLGVNPGSVRTVSSPQSYNDGRWHLAVGTLSPAGLALYLDGAPVATDAATTTAQGGTTATGYWRVGWDGLGGWTSQPATDYWTGSLAYAAVYPSALADAQVRQLYAAGT